MAAKYESIKYDLRAFGITEIKSAIISSDKDSGVSIEVSFDGGSTFTVYPINEKIDLIESPSLIVVRINFPNLPSGIYLISVAGNYQMLSIGTYLYFDNSNGTQYKTTIGVKGEYKISIPPGTYTIWYHDKNKNKIILGSGYSPELYANTAEPAAKENMVEMFLRDVNWATYAIFDVFENLDKMSTGNATLDINGNLIDESTNTICRWWAIGLK